MRSRRTRSGYSLIECLVFLTAASVLLGLSGVLLQRLLSLDRADRQRIAAAENVERLGRSLRSDAHSARSWTKTPPGQVSLKLINGDEVAYRLEPTRIVRTVNRTNKTTHHDVFALPRDVSAEIKLEGQMPKAATLTVSLDQRESPGRVADGLMKQYTIEATLGRHSRLAREAKP